MRPPEGQDSVEADRLPRREAEILQAPSSRTDGVPTITPKHLLHAAGLEPHGPVAWGTPLPTSEHGVYVVEWPGPPPKAPVSDKLIQEWIHACPCLRIETEKTAPDSGRLAERIASFWVANQGILYIGKAAAKRRGNVGGLRKRLDQFYGTVLGDAGPHRGGIWLKTLADYCRFARVWWAETPPRTLARIGLSSPKAVEGELLRAFSLESQGQLPFANLLGLGILKSRWLKNPVR